MLEVYSVTLGRDWLGKWYVVFNRTILHRTLLQVILK
jgi:hypothetical protein